MMKLGVIGAGGRMGCALIRAIAEDDRVHLAAATEAPGSPFLGRDAGSVAEIGEQGVSIAAGNQSFAGCDAVLDFTAPKVSLALAADLAGLGVGHVIGTTGFDAQDDAALAEAAAVIPIVKSGNMSLGVNLLAALVRQAARALPQADIEVLEMHHRKKVDAPSGTALLLGEAAAEGRGIALRENAVFAREGHTGERVEGTIGFATLRGGTVIGEHDVIFAMNGERMTLGHMADDRMIYARGAVAAALFLRGRSPKLYSMADVLGIDP